MMGQFTNDGGPMDVLPEHSDNMHLNLSVIICHLGSPTSDTSRNTLSSPWPELSRKDRLLSKI